MRYCIADLAIISHFPTTRGMPTSFVLNSFRLLNVMLIPEKENLVGLLETMSDLIAADSCAPHLLLTLKLGRQIATKVCSLLCPPIPNSSATIASYVVQVQSCCKRFLSSLFLCVSSCSTSIVLILPIIRLGVRQNCGTISVQTPSTTFSCI